MLKFVSTDSNNNCLSSSLAEIKDIDEFLNKNSAKEIYDYLNNQWENSNKKDKSSSNFINKILPMMFFEHTNKNNFSFGDSSKANIEKILEVSILVNELSYSHIEIFLKLYFILSSNNRGRYFLIFKFFSYLNKESKDSDFLAKIEFKFEAIENMLSDFFMNDKSYERKEMILFYEEFSLFIVKNKLFENMKK